MKKRLNPGSIHELADQYCSAQRKWEQARAAFCKGLEPMLRQLVARFNTSRWHIGTTPVIIKMERPKNLHQGSDVVEIVTYERTWLIPAPIHEDALYLTKQRIRRVLKILKAEPKKGWQC